MAMKQNEAEPRLNYGEQQNGYGGSSVASDTVPIHGFQQVVEMLRVADPEFRAMLLKSLAKRDQNLVQSLMRYL